VPAANATRLNRRREPRSEIIGGEANPPEMPLGAAVSDWIGIAYRNGKPQGQPCLAQGCNVARAALRQNRRLGCARDKSGPRVTAYIPGLSSFFGSGPTGDIRNERDRQLKRPYFSVRQPPNRHTTRILPPLNKDTRGKYGQYPAAQLFSVKLIRARKFCHVDVARHI
jgi:hypothetical protein